MACWMDAKWDVEHFFFINISLKLPVNPRSFGFMWYFTYSEIREADGCRFCVKNKDDKDANSGRIWA